MILLGALVDHRTQPELRMSSTDLDRQTATRAPTPPAALPGEPAAPAAWKHRFPAANSLATAMALSACAGFLDGFTFVGHGHVFASAMTGNMVLLGVHIANDRDVWTFVLPLIAYISGVIVAHAMLRETPRRLFRYQPHVFTLCVEIVVLVALALLPHNLNDDLLVPIITISTAMQNTTFRNLGTRTYNSIIMTGNLQAFSNALAAGVSPFTPAKLREARDLAAIITSFISGAALGAALTGPLGLRALLVPAGVLATGAVILMLSRDGT